MKTRTKVIIATLALMVPAGIAVAHGKSSKRAEHHKAVMLELFDAADADKDGAVTQAEIYSFRKSLFTENDANGDGALSADELHQIMGTMMKSKHAHRLARMDSDGDGKVSGEEFARTRTPGLRRVDSNGDGAITKEEIENMGSMRRGGQHGMHGRN